MLLHQPSLDVSRDKTSPDKAKTSPVTPAEEQINDQRCLPPGQPIAEGEGSTERMSPLASVKPGMEAADPAVISHGNHVILYLCTVIAVQNVSSLFFLLF